MGKKAFWVKTASFLCVLLFAAGFMGMRTLAAEEDSMRIVFTHDLHSHLGSFVTSLDGEEQEVGGFARIESLIRDTKEEDPDTLVVDGGDFSMGTLYQTVYETQAAELRMLGFLGVEVTTLGNHEFDFRTNGLTNMLNSAADSGDALPVLALCNVDWESTLSEESKDVPALKEAFDNYGIKPYTMLKKGELNIAVIGVFGNDALACAPTCELVFKDPIKAVKETVAQIQENEDADMIVCVSHSGTWEDESKSEDEILAKQVPQLDLIISGHTHSTLDEPIVHGSTSIVSTGEYGIRAGKIKMTRNEEGRWDIEDYELVKMDQKIEEDPEALEKIEELGKTIDSAYLSQFDYTRNQVLAYNPWEYPSLGEMEEQASEQPFGNLLADSYLYTVNSISTGETPAQVAVVPAGVIRDVFSQEEDVTVSDVFNVFSLGIGPDGVSGYPLISVYLTGEEIRTMAEVDASISPMMSTAQLYTSGLAYRMNPNRLILNKVTGIELYDTEGNEQEVKDDELYRVIADLYTGQMLGAVSDQSFGILSVVPKDAQGNPVENLEDSIVMDNGQEVKAWWALARYVESFGKEADGSIPVYYSENKERKIIEDDSSIGAIIKNPNKIALAIIGAGAAAIVILVLIVVFTLRFVKKRRRCQHTE